MKTSRFFQDSLFLIVFFIMPITLVQARPIRPFSAGPGSIEEIFGTFYRNNNFSTIVFGSEYQSEDNSENYRQIVLVEPIDRNDPTICPERHVCKVRVYLADDTYREILFHDSTSGTAESTNPGMAIEDKHHAFLQLVASTQHYEFGYAFDSISNYLNRIGSAQISLREVVAIAAAMGLVSYGTSVWLATIWDPINTQVFNSFRIMANEYGTLLQDLRALDNEAFRQVLRGNLGLKVKKFHVYSTHTMDLSKALLQEEIDAIKMDLAEIKTRARKTLGLKISVNSSGLVRGTPTLSFIVRKNLIRRLFTSTVPLRTPRGAAIGAFRAAAYLDFFILGYAVAQSWSDDAYYSSHLEELFQMPKESARKFVAKNPQTEKTLRLFWWALNRSNAMKILTDDAIADEYAEAALLSYFPDPSQDS